LKFKFFIFSVLIIVTFCFTGCHGSDDEIAPQIFLEKYEGTKWIINSWEDRDPPYLIVIRINNDTIKPLEGWEFFDFAECYNYSENYLEDYPPNEITIVENLNDKLVYNIKYGNGDVGVMTITIRERTLTQKFEWPDNTTTNIWIESNIDVDNFTPLCVR